MTRKSFGLTGILLICSSIVGFPQWPSLLNRVVPKPMIQPPRPTILIPKPAPVIIDDILISTPSYPYGAGRHLPIINPNRDNLPYNYYNKTYNNNNTYWNDNTLSIEEKSILEWYRLYVKRKQHIELEPKDPYLGLSTLDTYGKFEQDEQLTTNEIFFIKRIKADPVISAALKEFKLSWNNAPHSNTKPVYDRPVIKTPPVIKTISARDHVTKMFRKYGFNTRLGTWYNTINVNSPGKTIYLETINDNNAVIAESHLYLINKGAPDFARQHKGPFSNFFIVNNFLYMVYIDAQKNISSFVHLKNKNLKKYIAAFAALSNDQTVNFIIGDNKQVMETIETSFHELGLDCYKRRSNVDTELPLSEKINRLHILKERPLELSSTTIINGLPENAVTAWKQGFAKNDLGDILHLKEMMDTWFTSANKKISNKEAFINELQHGNNDIVVAFAHADGHSIYINDEKITLKEFEKLKKRDIASSKPRIIILVACNTGNIYATRGLIFKRDLKSISQIMIEKGFADYVIAPNCEITNVDITDFFNKLLSGIKLGELSKSGIMKFIKTSAFIQGKAVNINIYFKNNAEIKYNIHS
jgi:hypothetical protein